MVKAVIFDLDGTIVNTLESIARPVNEQLKKYGLPPAPVEKFRYFAGDGMQNTWRRALAWAGADDPAYLTDGYEEMIASFNADPLYHNTPCEGMPEAVAALKSRGVLCAVLSNKVHQSAVRVVRQAYGPDVFDYVQGQCDTVPLKPSPEGVYAILDRFGLQKRDCLYLGDTNTDMQTGKNAGLVTAGVTWGFRTRSELEAAGADTIIDSPSRILPLAESL